MIWLTKVLTEVSDINPAKTAVRGFLKDDDLVSFVPMEDMGVVRKNIIAKQTRAIKDVLKNYTYFADGDVLLAKITPCFENGKVGIAQGLVNGTGFGSSEYIVFRTKAMLIPDYLFYVLSSESFRTEGRQNMFGAIGHKRVSKDFIENYTIRFPDSLGEQRRIVEVIENAFSTLEKLKESYIANLEEVDGLLDAFFQNVLAPKYPIRKLGELCEYVEYGSSAKSIEKGKIAVLRMGNIQRGVVDWGNLVYSDDEEEIRKLSLNNNDVLFNRTNSPELVGKSAIYKGEMPAIFAGYLIRIHRKESLLDADYLNYFLNSSLARDYGKKVMSSSVHQANINGSKLKDYPIPAPTLNEQKKIVTKLNALTHRTKKLESLYRQKLTLLEELKKSILHKAFSGEL